MIKQLFLRNFWDEVCGKEPEPGTVPGIKKEKERGEEREGKKEE